MGTTSENGDTLPNYILAFFFFHIWEFLCENCEWEEIENIIFFHGESNYLSMGKIIGQGDIFRDGKNSQEY